MHSMFLVLMLTLAIATQGFDLTEKEGNRTSTGSHSRPSFITDKQINNAHFSRRTILPTHETEKPLDRTARHTMIVDTQILDSRFQMRSIDKRGDSDMSRTRRGVSFIDTKGSGNRIVKHPARSYNEFIVEGDSGSAPALFIHNGQSVNVMRIVPSSNGAANTPNTQAMQNVQAMPMNGNGMNRPSSQSFSSPSASRPQAPFTGIVQGGVINGATFTRRSVDGQDKADIPLERQSRDTFVDGSWINRGRFSRRSADGQDKADMPLERQSRDTYIGKSQINDGRFSRRSANGLGGEDMPLDRNYRDTHITKSQINDGQFSRRNTAEHASEEKVST